MSQPATQLVKPPGGEVVPHRRGRAYGAFPDAMARGTLSRQLVLRTTLLVAIVAIVLSAITSLGIYQIQMQQLDQRLISSAGRTQPTSTGRGDPFGFGGIGVRIYSKGTTGAYETAGTGDLSDEALAQLAALPDITAPATVHIKDLGAYRVVVHTDSNSGVKVTSVFGLPLTEVVNTMTRQLIMAALLTLASILLAFFAVRSVVVRSLRPLNRLAATAQAVSNLELDRGEVTVPRVAAEDANPTSEVGRVGQAFNHMLDNVEGALAVRQQSETKLRQFVADASHELRNPLASIRGYSELTRRSRDELPEPTQHALSRIESESDRMSTLVEDLLLLARLDSGPNLDITRTDLTEIIVNAVSDAQVAGRDHLWRLSLPDEPVEAMADSHRLHQVVVNLLANARTHTPAGTEVTTSLSREGQWAVVSIHDNGPGIAPEVLPTVFERFTRAEASRYRKSGEKSTGLGLAIVQAVVGAHGGMASVASVPGDTTFTVRIPLAD